MGFIIGSGRRIMGMGIRRRRLGVGMLLIAEGDARATDQELRELLSWWLRSAGGLKMRGPVRC